MSTKTKVDALWQELRKAINATYADGQRVPTGDAAHESNCLRDYVEDMSWHDDLAKLVGREAANERQHRRGNGSAKGFSVDTAAKLILLNSVSRGARGKAMPSATEFLVFRQTAVEAAVIGWLVRDHLDSVWHEELEKLDYAKEMEAQRA